MALKGDTSNLLLADIFQTLSQNRQKGLLELRGEDCSFHVLFSPLGVTLYDARVFAASRLAHLLVAGRLVTTLQMEPILQEVETNQAGQFSSIPLLVLLDEHDLLPLDKGTAVLCAEVREELFEVFTSPRMEFEFNDDEIPPQALPKGCFFRPEEIVMDAARRMDEWAMIQEQVTSLQDYFVADVDATGDDIDPRIVRLLDGSNTIVDISERLVMSRFNTSRTTWRLLEAKQARQASPDELVSAALRLDPATDRQRITRILQRARGRLRPSDPRLDEIGDMLVRVGADTAAISVMLVRARSLMAEGTIETAHAQVLRAQELDQNHLGVLQTLAEIHEARGEREAEAQVLVKLAERCAASGKYHDAVEFAARLARLDPDSPLLDRAFATYCQRASAEKRGADILSEAAGLRTTAIRAAILYDSILILDPTRGDVRKARSRHLRNRTRRRTTSVVLAVLLSVLAFIVTTHFTRSMDEQRLTGQVDSAELLLSKGEVDLAAAQLAAIVEARPEGELKERVSHLFEMARTEIARNERQQRSEQEQLQLKELAQLQLAIEAGSYRSSMERIARLVDEESGGSKSARLVTKIATKRKLLVQKLREEHAALNRLANQFQVPESDTELAEVQLRFGAAFSAERETEFRRLEEWLSTADAGTSVGGEMSELPRLTRECLGAFERVGPGLASVRDRLERNVALDVLSEDFQVIQKAETDGRYEAALQGYDHLLRDYGDGTLSSYFEERRAAVAGVVEMLAEMRRLVEQDEIEPANDLARLCAERWPDLEVGRTVGRPIRIESLPAAAEVTKDERTLGTTPIVVWVRQQQQTRLQLALPGFLPSELPLEPDSDHVQTIELRRADRFVIRLDKVIDVSPTLHDGRILIGGRDGALVRLDVRSGAEVDRHATGSLSGIATPPLVVGDRIILTLGEGQIRAVDSQSLQLRWNVDLSASLAGPPQVDQGMLYTATTTGQIHEISVSTGRERLITELAGTVRAGPVIKDRSLAVGLTSGAVIAISRDDGALLFQTAEDTQPVVGITVADRAFVVATDGGELRALDMTDGHPLWNLKTGLSTSAPPVAADGLLIFSAGKMTFVLDADTGELRTEAQATDWVAGSPALAGGRLYIGDRDGVLSVFDVNTGALLFRHRLEGVIRASPLVLPEGVLVISDVGVVTLIGA